MSSQNPWEFNGERVLVFSDVHQRLSWMNAVLEKEKGNYDKLVFLGDMFDTHHLENEVSGIRETAKAYVSLIENPNHLVLAGNHDIPYIESLPDSKKFSHKRHIFNPCSGFTKNKAIEIAKELDNDHVKKIRLFAVVNGWLLSHAGFSRFILQDAEERKGNQSIFDVLYADSLEAMAKMRVSSHKLLGCGYARGGDNRYGGLVWHDWMMEFEDCAELPQLVGHTYYRCPRQDGRSFCIDTGVTYAIIHRDGRLELKNLSAKKDGNGGFVWTGSEPQVLNMKDFS